MRRLAAVALYGLILVVAGLFVDSVSLWLAFGVGPVLTLDQYALRLLPWPQPIPGAAKLLPRLGLAVGIGIFLFINNYPFMYWSESLFLGIAFGLVLSLIGGLSDLGSALLDRWRTKSDRPRNRRWSLAAAVLATVVIGVGAQPLRTFHPFHSAVLTTPLQYGCEYEDVNVTTSDGLSLSGWYIPCPDAKGSVIFCHGYSGNRTPVCYYLELFRQHKLNILACDFRGHGKSPGWTAAFGAREYHDIVGAEDYLRLRAPGKPVLLFGTSYGAAVTIQSLPHLHDVRAAWAEAGFARLSGLWARKFTDVPETLRSPAMGFYNGIVWFDSGFAPLRVNAIDRIKEGHIPLFFCHGDKDEIVPITDSMEMYALYPGPKYCLWLEGAGHGNLVTVGGEEYQRRFDEFVTRYLFSES